VTDRKFPGNPTKSYRSKDPLRVVSEHLDWQGHFPGFVGQGALWILIAKVVRRQPRAEQALGADSPESNS